LVFGELVPKQISLAHPERIAILVSGPISLLATLSQPVVWLLDLSSRGVLAILPSSGPARSDVTEEDIHHALNEGAKVGEIRSLEKEMAMRIFRLDDRPITAFMTPRRDVVWLDSTGPLEDALQVALDSPHSFFPVSEGTLDNLLGVISVKELLHLERSGRTLSIRSLIKPIFKVPAGKDALGVLEDFKRERSQVAVVVDEHGGVSGVVTTHDLLEAIVGDLADFDGEAQSIVIRQDGSMLVDAGVDIHELLLKAGKDPSSAGPDEEYHSVGGLVFGELGKLPYVGASIEWNGLRFEIVDMDRNRIDKLLVSAPKALEAQNAAPPEAE
jgi:putative hemolysin